jgi:hypothetical protein
MQRASADPVFGSGRTTHSTDVARYVSHEHARAWAAEALRHKSTVLTVTGKDTWVCMHSPTHEPGCIGRVLLTLTPHTSNIHVEALLAPTRLFARVWTATEWLDINIHTHLPIGVL